MCGKHRSGDWWMVRVRGNADFVRQTPVLTIWYGKSPFPVPKCHTTRIGSGKAGFAVRIPRTNFSPAERHLAGQSQRLSSTSNRRRPLLEQRSVPGTERVGGSGSGPQTSTRAARRSRHRLKRAGAGGTCEALC